MISLLLRRSNWLIIAFIIWNSNIVPLLEGLCISNPCWFEFLVFWVFVGIETMITGLTVLRSDQLSRFYIVSAFKTLAIALKQVTQEREPEQWRKQNVQNVTDEITSSGSVISQDTDVCSASQNSRTVSQVEKIVHARWNKRKLHRTTMSLTRISNGGKKTLRKEWGVALNFLIWELLLPNVH